MNPRAITVYTIGHSNHPIDRFLALLKEHAIDVLVDIRRFPGSRKHPQFNQENLQASLRQETIDYLWLEELGGRRKAPSDASHNTALRNAGFRNYADYMQTAEFREGVKKLLDIGRERRTAMMCAEGLWWQCHRRLVSDYLLASQIPVEHILPDGKVKPHAMTPEARVAGGRVSYPAPKGLFEIDELDR